MGKIDIISKFERANKVEFFGFADNDHSVCKFFDGRHYDINDIEYHVNNNLSPELIQQYHDEGLNGSVNMDYKTWVESQKK